MLEFHSERRVTAAGPPGTGSTEFKEMECEGQNCFHMSVVVVNCTHDPAALEDTPNIVWACEETVEEVGHVHRTARHTAHSAVFVFSPERIVCDSNVSALQGLLWSPVDTTAVSTHSTLGADLLPDHVFLDPTTCRLVYSISNLGAPDEHFTLFLLLFFSCFFAVLVVCPAAGGWFMYAFLNSHTLL